MPLLKVEDVVSYVIGDEKVREHLRRSEIQRTRLGFRDYAARFGIYDLGELSDSQLFAIAAARNCAPIIDLLQIPRGKDRLGQNAYASYDLHRRKTSLSPAINAFVSSAPSSDQEWEVLHDPEDIPYAIPEDLLLRRRAPREFLRRLTERELLRSAWIQEDFDDLNSKPLDSPDASMRPDESRSMEDARPFGYLLLDASESMGTGRDRRDEVARGLALAYLLSQYEAGNPTSLYLFRHELSPTFGGETRAQFESAAAAVLAHSHEGMTNLQSALQLLSSVMSTQQQRVDIALITDGVTRLTENPLGDCHLHTFLVGVRPEEFDEIGGAQYHDSLLQLRTWSDFMFRIDPAVMRNASIPRREDVLDFGRILYGIREELEEVATPEMVRRIQNRLRNLVRFVSRYREFHGVGDGEIDALWQESRALSESIGKSEPVSIAMRNTTGWSPLDKDLAIALESRELATVLDTVPQGTKWSFRVYVPPKTLSPWEVLKLLWRALRARLKLRSRGRALRARAKKLSEALGLGQEASTSESSDD